LKIEEIELDDRPMHLIRLLGWKLKQDETRIKRSLLNVDEILIEYQKLKSIRK